MIVGGGRVQLLDRNDRPLSEVVVEGGFLLPLGPDVEVMLEDPLVLRLVYGRVGDPSSDSSETPDVPVGWIPLVIQRPDGNGETIYELEIPAPTGFTEATIDEMWCSLSSSPATQAALRRAGLWRAGEHRSESDCGAHLPSLPDLLAQTRHLLRHWPQRESLSMAWRPVGQAGGPEDVRETVRQLARAGSVVVDGAGLPARTLRRQGSHEPWTLHAVRDMATTVIKRLAELPEVFSSQDGAGLLAPVAVLAELAEPPPGSRDVPPSSWPAQFRMWSEQALAVIADVSAHGVGTGRAPLCQFRDLFEAWLAVEVHRIFERHLGHPWRRMEIADDLTRFGKPAWRSSWTVGDLEVEVWAQPAIGRKPVHLDNGGPARSVTSELIPDGLVVVTGPNGTYRHAIDAKFTTGSQIRASTVAETGSKYLWGLRRASSDALALDRVSIVSNGRAKVPFDGDMSMIDSLEVRPNSGLDELTASIIGPLAGRFPEVFQC